MSETYAIIGAGHAAGQAAATLRLQGFDGRIVLVGDEPYLPYQRPPLSKKFLAGELAQERLYFKPPNFYEEQNVEVKLGTRARALDPDGKTVDLGDGKKLAYDKLLLTTGSRVRKIQVPGADLPGVFYLRTIEDVLAIQDDLSPGAKLVIVGGGYIGLEVASVSVKKGVDVTVVEMEDRLMSRVVSPEMSAFYREFHTAQSVSIECATAVSGFEGRDRVQRVLGADGRKFEADLVVIGIGIVPDTDLAGAAGLHCDNGVYVDEYCRTSAPEIWAAGDCTNHPSALFGGRVRLESVQNAVEQAKCAAHVMCGDMKPYDQVPWFWSDQYDLKLQMAGLSDGYDHKVCRGRPADGSFAVFYYKGKRVIAVEAVNSPREFMVGRKLIGERAFVAPERLVDTSIAMSEVV